MTHETRTRTHTPTRGIGLAEVLVAVAILSVIAVLSYVGLTQVHSEQVLERNASVTLAVFERARSLTLASRDAVRYGVHVESERVVLFSGDAYNPTDVSNLVEELDNRAPVSAHAFAGGGSAVLFDFLTGETQQFGTLTLTLTANPSRTRTVTIHRTGLAELD